MGHYADGQLDSAVMIRFIEQENGQLHFKAGGGITAKSRWESEYNEVIQKIICAYLLKPYASTTEGSATFPATTGG